MKISTLGRIGKYALASGLLGLIPLRAAHATAGPDAPVAHNVKVSDSFEIGLEGQYYQYREPLFAKLEGYGIGLNATYTYNWRDYFLKANVIADFYNLDYSSNGTGSDSGITDYKQDYRGLFGYNFRFSKQTSVSPYLGLGYRMLFDAEGLTSTSTGAVGYNRRSQYLYVPIGVGVGFHAGKWGFNTFGEYDYLIQGWQTSYLRDDGTDNNIQNGQSAGFGVRGAIMVTPPIDFYNFSFGPYVRYWNIHNSDVQPLYQGGSVVGFGMEPANNTLEYGIAASLKFQ